MDSLLHRTHYSGWSNSGSSDERFVNFKSLELDVNYKCNLACKYCYVARYGEQLYPHELYEDEERIVNNAKIYLNWLKENNYRPNIEIFSGEPLVQDVCFRVIDEVIETCGSYYSPSLMIPTNYTFLMSKSLTERVEKMIEKGASHGVPVYLSSSVDGKYAESNRPFRATVDTMEPDHRRSFDWTYKSPPGPRTDEFYDNMFKFAKKYGYGFHPMVYSQEVEKWRDNFIWFQEMFRKHDIPWTKLYLLEVRNSEWSKQQTIDFGKFIEFLIHWSWDMCNGDFDTFWNKFIIQARGFNMLSNPFTQIGRGLGCSYQSSIQLRLGDLGIMPCHRNSYSHMMIGNYIVENEKITGIKARNPEMAIAGISFDARSFPYCEQCAINEACSKGCLGAQLEVTGDMFTPIPTMCRMEHEKIWAMIRAYRKLGVINKIYSKLSVAKRNNFENVEKMMVCQK